MTPAERQALVAKVRRDAVPAEIGPFVALPSSAPVA
jgi:hypothetical protein